MGNRWKFRTGVMAMGILLSGAPARAEQGLVDALTTGKFDLYLRLRYEFVDDKQNVPAPLEDANALTLRTALGYNTGLFHKFGLYLQVEDVRALVERYNDGGTNGKTQFATVVDPKDTEVQQANIRYEGIPNTLFRLGRQDIEHRRAPLHRYVGNVLWRQIWQSFDAFRATASFLPDESTGERQLKADYAYVWNVNRIFGEDNPLPDRSNFPMKSNFIKINYDGFKWVKFEAYSYLLDFDHSVSAKFSTNTFGIRGEGNYAIGRHWKLLYTGEFANQMNAYNNPADININYYLGEFGASYKLSRKWLDTVTVKLSYEVLEGDGTVSGIGRAFQTPLGTNHAFQGWADRFLVTPGDGIEDAYVTLKMDGYGATFMLVYHNFASNHDDYDYGTEWDMVLEKPFLKHWLVGLKYAAYDASSDALNQARNSVSGQAFDLNKFWAYIQFNF